MDKETGFVDNGETGLKWYEDKKYDFFWKNYNYVFNNCKSQSQSEHGKLYENYMKYFCAAKSASLSAHLAALNSLSLQEQTNKTKHKKRRQSRRKKKNSKSVPENEIVNEVDLNENEAISNDEKKKRKSKNKEKFELQISDELLEFYETSFRFKKEKKELEKQRLKNYGGSSKSEYVSGEQYKATANTWSTSAPLERVGQEREQELKKLYGKASTQIQMAETELQMNYDKNLDLYQPIYWPSFPLKLKFN